MNRRQLFNDMWKMLIGKPIMWMVVLLGSGVGTVISLVLSNLSLHGAASIAVSVLDTFVSLVVAAFVTGAIIWMVNAVAEGRAISMNDGLQAGTRKLAPLFFVRLVLLLPIWIVILIFTGSFLAVFTSALGRPTGIEPSSLMLLLTGGGFIGLVIVILIVGVVTSLINIGADRAVMLEDLAVFAALKRGWQLAREKFSDFVGLGVYMLIVGLGVALLYSCTIGALISSAVIGQVTSSGNFNPTATFGTPLIVSTLASLVLNSFLETLFSGVWTLAFRKWQGK